MRCGGRPMVSRPAMRIEPVRLAVSPRMDRSVLVRPAPLRPSSVMHSPALTSRSMPWSTCDSPYHAWTSRIASMASLMFFGSHVGLAHRRIRRHAGIRPFRQYLAALKHGDGVADVGDDLHVVFDHQHGAAGRHGLDQVLDAVDILVAHALRRLV